MKYVLTICEGTEGLGTLRDTERCPQYMAGWMAYTKALIDAGVMAGGAGLQLPETATTLRVRDGKREVHDGPYAETKEQLNGFFIIDVPDLDAALQWAERAPLADGGAVEVRPTIAPPGQ